MASLDDEMRALGIGKGRGMSALDKEMSVLGIAPRQPEPEPDEGILSNIVKGAVSGGAGTIGGLAGWFGGKNAVTDYTDEVLQENQRSREHDGYDADYFLNGSGFAYDVGNLLGSFASMAPAALLVPGGAPATIASAGARLLGGLGARELARRAAVQAAQKGGGALGNYIRYGLGAGTAESLVEGGSGVSRAVQEGQEGLSPYLTGAEIAAKNWPLLVGSQTLEGAILHRGFSRLGGKAGESLKTRAALAGPRALPYMAAEGVTESGQEVMQERAQEEAFGEPTGGLLPDTWTDAEKKAFYATFAPAALLGGVGGVRGSMRQTPTNRPPERQDYLATWDDSMGKIDSRYSSKWESQPGATDLANLQDSVAAKWNGLASEYGGGLTITGGAEKGYHAGGEDGHEGGWKIDVDKDSVQDEAKFLDLARKYGFAVGDEGDHYDLSANPNGKVGGEVKVSHEEAGTTGGGGWSNANAKAIYDVFRAEGYNDNAIAGILGRVQQEHNFETSNVEEHWDTDENGNKVWVGGYGMFQWNGGRTTDFLNWAQENGLDPQNPTVQAQYALIEAKQKGLTPERMNQLTHEEAADVWTDEWEVGNKGREREYADNWLNVIKNGGGGSVSTPSTSSVPNVEAPQVGTYDDVYEEFAKEYYKDADEQEKDLFKGMFTMEGDFIDNEENRRRIDDMEEFEEWKARKNNPSLNDEFQKLINQSVKNGDHALNQKLMEAKMSGNIQLMQKYVDEARAQQGNAQPIQASQVAQPTAQPAFPIVQQEPQPTAQPAFPVVPQEQPVQQVEATQTPIQNAPQPAQQAQQAQPIVEPATPIEAVRVPKGEEINGNTENTESTQAQAQQTPPSVNQNQYAESGQAEAQEVAQEASQAPAQADGFTNSTVTTKKGKQYPGVTWEGRVDKDEWKRRNGIAKQHNGWWSKNDKSFGFATEQDRDAFLAEMNGTPAQSEPASTTTSTPVQEAPQEAPKKEPVSLKQFKKNVAKIVADYRADKITYDEAWHKVIEAQENAERVAPDQATKDEIEDVARNALSQLSAIYNEKNGHEVGEEHSQTAQKTAEQQEQAQAEEEPAKAETEATQPKQQTVEQPAQKGNKSDSVEKYIKDRHPDHAAEIRKDLYDEMETWDEETQSHKKITYAQFLENFAKTPGARVYYKAPASNGLAGDIGAYVYQNDKMKADNYEPTLSPLGYDYLKHLLSQNSKAKKPVVAENAQTEKPQKEGAENAPSKQEKPQETENNTAKTPEQMNEDELEDWLLHASEKEVEQWAKTTPYKKVSQSGSSFIIDTFYNTETGKEFTICVRDYDYDGSRDINVLYEMPIDKEAYKAWQHKHGKIVEGDTVKVVKGRKVPVGTISKVKKIRAVDDKYGRWVADYAVLENGQSTNVENCQRIDEEAKGEGAENNTTKGKEYKYYMNQRPVSPGAQPKGFTRFDEEDKGGKYGAIYYDRPLTEQEIADYELTPAKEEARNEQQGESGSPDGGHSGVRTGESRSDQREDAGEVSGHDGRKGEGHGSDNVEGHSEEPKSAGVRAGTELDTSAGKGTDKRGNQPDVPLTEAQAHPSPTETPGHNYEIKENEGDPNKRNADVRYKQNIDAIKLLRQLEDEERMATPAEQKILAQFNGWGGLTSKFKEGSETDKELRSLLSAEEYRDAQRSSLSAYYTPPKIVKAIWAGLSHLGFKGGRILDPAMGVGNFFGCMPRDIMAKSVLDGVEMESLAARLARQLYPGADVQNAAFQRSNTPKNFYDLVITNVPFEQTIVNGYQVHNYYFAAGIDKVRPGGLMVYITGQGSLASGSDAARMRTYLNKEADLIGAFKLPSGVFDATNVGTDVVVFQKRIDGKKSPHGQDFTNVQNRGSYGVNTYFMDNRDNVLGEMSVGTNRFGQPELNVRRRKDATNEDVAKDLEAAMKKLPENVYEPVSRNKAKQFNPSETAKRAKADEKTRDREYYYKDGKIVQNQNGQETEIKGKQAEVVESYVKLKNSLNALLAAETDPKATDKQVEGLRDMLNRDYNDFVKKHGYLHGANKRHFDDDPSSGMVQSLETPIETEEKTKSGATKKKVTGAKKASIFSERSTNPKKEVTHVDTASDALVASLNNTGGLDLEYMAKLTGKAQEKLLSELKGTIFKDPATENFVTKDEYLSGNVREKLILAKEVAKRDKSYTANVKALEEVQPEELVPEEIFVSLGTPWIPAQDVNDFVHTIANGRFTIHYNSALAKWTVTGSPSSTKFGTQDISFDSFLAKVLNGQVIEITYTDENKKTHVNEAATKAVTAEAERLQAAFKEWIWKDKERAKRLADYYNANFNNYVLREYDGSHLDPHQHGANSKITLKPHQKNAVWRILQSGNTLLAHCVGAGKTFEMQTAGMEMRRLGMANKPMYLVPLNVVDQFAQDFRKLYPGAKLLVLTNDDLPKVKLTKKVNKTDDGRIEIIDLTKDMSAKEKERIAKNKAKRARTLARIRTEDWDGIIMSHTLFKELPVSPETQSAYMEEESKRLEAALKEAKQTDSLDGNAKRTLEDQKAKLQEKMEEARSVDVKDLGITFEQLGIDQLFVDEADLFKNLHFTSSKTSGNDKIKGITNPKANYKHRAFDMFLKTQWLSKTLNRRGVVFATGTPISNSMAELYTMMRYLDPQGLKEHGTELFDSWIGVFGDIGQDTQLNSTGTNWETVTKVRSYNNRPELLKMFRKFADIKQPSDLPDIKRPNLKGGKPTIIELPVDPTVSRYLKERVPKRIAAMSGGFKKHKGEDNMLALMNDLRNLSLSDSKIEACADTIVEEYKDSTPVKGTQLVFCDLGIPKAESEKEDAEEDEGSPKKVSEIANPDVYRKLIEKLVKKGIPREQIAFIQDYPKDKRQAVFEKVNNGEIRILIGSTTAMGAGTNCQKHLVALHDLDAPWRPRDLEQRHGRILRQGNENSEVSIYQYALKGSFDAVIWSKLKEKALLIELAMSGDMNSRSMEEADIITLEYNEMVGASLDDPLMKEKVDTENELSKVRNAQTEFSKRVQKADNTLATIDDKIETHQKAIEHIKKDIAGRKSTRGDNFSMTVGNKTFTKRDDAGNAMEARLKDFDESKPTVVGSLGGFALKAVKTITGIEMEVVGKHAYPVKTISVQGLEHTVNVQVDDTLEREEAYLEYLNQQKKDALDIHGQENPYTEKVKTLEEKLADLNRQIKERAVEESKKQNDTETEEAQEEKPSSNRQYSISSKAKATDAEYMVAVDEYQNAASDEDKSKALKKLQNMVEDAAAKAGFENAIPEQTVAYKTRTKAAPKKTVKVYKVFTVAGDGSPTALFIGGTEKLPQGVWLDAQDAYHFLAKNGKYYVPSTQNPYTKGGKTGAQVEIPNEEVRQELVKRGFIKAGSTASKITALAYRPGWHAGTLPFFPQGGMKPPKGMKSGYPNIHRYNQVVFECELSADKDYTQEAENQPKARKKDGTLNTRDADLQYMPEDGYYYYATNPMTHGHPELGMWAISGSLKINRALTQEECDRILAEHNMPAQEWEQGKMNLEDLGYTGPQNDAARKTLAPITYDDNGNVIPLSERFNPEIDDVRFSVNDEDNARSVDDLKAEIRDEYSYAKVEDNGDSMSVTMPNGQTLRVDFYGNIEATDKELSEAKKAHNLADSMTATVEGYAEVVDGKGIMALSQASKDGTGYHEAYHLAERLAFTKKELADAKRLISPDAEVRADEYAKWKLSRKKGNNFAKLWQKIADMAAKLASVFGVETKHNIYRKVASGEVYRRDNTANGTSGRQYSLMSDDNSKAGLRRKISNLLAGKKNSPLYRRRVKELMEDIAGIKIYYGKTTRDFYAPFEKYIRVQKANDWDSMTYHFSHAVCDKLGISWNDTMGNYVSSWLLTGEATNDSQEAKTFMKAMAENVPIREQLLDLQEAFANWRRMKPSDRIGATISYENEEKTTWGKQLNKLYDQFIEELGPVKRLVESIEKKSGVKQSTLTNPYSAFRLFRGATGRAMTMIDGNAEAIDGLRKMFPAINWDGFKTIHMILESIGAIKNQQVREDFDKYIIAKHVLDIHSFNHGLEGQIAKLRNEMDATSDQKKKKEIEDKINALEARFMETPNTEADCRATIAEFDDRFSEAQQDLVHYSNTMLAIIHDSGIISDTRYEKLLKKWPNYVPMFRVFDDNDQAQWGDSLKHVEGSPRDMIEPLQSIIRNTFDMVRRAEKNKCKNLLANLAEMDGAGKVLTKTEKSAPQDGTTIVFYRNGEKCYLQTDPSVVEAVNTMGMDNASLFIRLMRFPASLARAVFTTLNPSFLIRNTIRDIQDAFVYNKHGYVTPFDIVRAFMDFLSGARHAFKKDSVYWEWLASGAAQASAASIDRDYVQSAIDKYTDTKLQALRKHPVEFSTDWLLKLAEISEFGTRIGAYERVKKTLAKDGRNVTRMELAEAALESRDLMDFARGGRSSRTWNRLAIFANASLQGWDKFFRTFNFKKRPKEATMALARLTFASLLPAFILALLHKDEDWWKELPDWQKNTNWIISDNFRLPKGQDIGLRVTSALIDKMFDDRPDKFKRGIWEPIKEQLPSLIPTAMLPIGEAYVNKSMFKDAPIVPRYQENLPAKLQYAPTTSSMAKWLGEQLNISPRKIEHVAYGYAGNWARAGLNAYDYATGTKRMNTAVEEMPVISGVMMTPFKNSQTVTDFYNELQRQREGDKAFKETHERMEGYNPAKYKRMNAASKKISELNKKERKLLDDNRISPERKQELQAGIQRQRIAIAKRAMGVR